MMISHRDWLTGMGCFRKYTPWLQQGRRMFTVWPLGSAINNCYH